MKNTIKKAIKYSCYFLPVFIFACWIAAFHSVQIMSVEQKQLYEISDSVLIIATMVQTSLICLVCFFLGYILANKTNLLKKINFEKKLVIKMLVFIFIIVCILLSDYLLFAKFMPEVKLTYTRQYYNIWTIATGALYGGIVEEILLRFFGISLCVFLLWKLFARKNAIQNLPKWIYIIANIIVAFLFAVGHIPAIINVFGSLSLLLVVRCFILNGIASIFLSDLYIKGGLHYSIIAHGISNIISTIIIMVII